MIRIAGKKLVVVVAASVLMGSAVYAATNYFASIQAETGSRSGSVAAVNDTSTSGGSAVKFGSEAMACAVNTPNVPDGTDPWGGCWPGPSTTGVAGCPALTTHNGDMVITSSNTTIENRLINGQIRANTEELTNVVVRCVKVVYGGSFAIDTERWNNLDPAQVLLDRVEVDCQGSAAANAGVLLAGATARNMRVYNCSDGFRFVESATIEDSYCHDLNTSDPDAHYDCAQTSGGEDFVLRHNTMVGRDTSDIAVWPEVWGGAVVPVRNVLIERNLLIGAPGYRIYVGKDHPGVPGNTNSSTDITVRENRLNRGGWGPCSVVNATPIWQDNRFVDNDELIPLGAC